MTREDAISEMLAWANGTKSYNTLFLSVEGESGQRPQTLAAVAVADAAETVKWAAVVLSYEAANSQSRGES